MVPKEVREDQRRQLEDPEGTPQVTGQVSESVQVLRPEHDPVGQRPNTPVTDQEEGLRRVDEDVGPVVIGSGPTPTSETFGPGKYWGPEVNHGRSR